MNRRHEYGFTLGFPIERNRLFGFLSFDQTRLSVEQNYVRDIFLASELALPRLTRGNDTPENRRFIESVLARFPSNLVPNDPRSNRTGAGIQGLSFPDRDYSGRLAWEPRSADHLTARWQYTRQIREPRVGFAWSPGGKDGILGKIAGGPGNASIRGGYGLYHGRLFQSVFSQAGASIRTNPPNALFLEFNNVPTLADPTGGFVFRPGPQTVRHAETHADPGLEMPYTHQWNLTYERKMPWNSTLRLSYTGNHGVGLLRYTISNLRVSPLAGGIVVVDHPNNAPAAGFPDLRGVKIDRIADDVLCAGTGFLPGINPNAQCPNPVPIANNEISFRVRRNNERRPDPRFTNVLLVSNGATSDYHGLQAEWTKTLSQGLQFLLSYTWSKAIDDTSEATFVGAGDTNQLGPDRKFARGLSRFDTRHRLTLNGSYRMPFFKDRGGIREAALAGWQVSMLMKLASGTPFTVIDTSGVDLNFDGFSDTRPVILDPSILGNSVDHPGASPAQLPRAAFRVAGFGDYDKLVGRNTFFGDGYARFDFGLHKTFRMPVEGHRLIFRAELFNAFNHVQYAFPTGDLASATFGRIVGLANTYEPRTLQFALRYQF